MASTLNGTKVLDTYFLEMRARSLEIAASLDRIERASGGGEVMQGDPRIAQLQAAIAVLGAQGISNRAEQIQMIFSIQD